MGLFLKKGNWYIDYYACGKRKREKIGTSKTLAENVLRKRKLELAENKYLDIRREQKIKFEEFGETFLNLYSKPNKKSWKSDAFNLGALAKTFGGKYLYEITTQDVEEHKARRSKDVSPATTNRELATLKIMFNKAVEWGKLKENPAKSVKFLREPKGRVRYLEREEIAKLLSNCSERLKPIVIVALNTGMRRGEILNLKWRDVDFQRGIIYLLDTKNGERREVPMNDLVKKALIAVRKHPDSPFIFCDKDGRPYGKVTKSFYTALKKAGIMNFRFHDLRHTYASQLVMAGIDINTTRELLGHKDIRMTLRYAHLSPDYKKQAVDILGKRMDTFWTPEAVSGKSQDLLVPELFENIEVK
ncbi:MAG: site-specific integrase [Candidatus Omnitrophota bacterium]